MDDIEFVVMEYGEIIASYDTLEDAKAAFPECCIKMLVPEVKIQFVLDAIEAFKKAGTKS